MGVRGAHEQSITADRLALAARGDQSAWRELVDIYARRVFALVRSKGIGAELAEEITQSVFATCAAKLTGGGYDEKGRFEAWLFRIAINRVRDEARRRTRQADPTDPVHFTAVASTDSAASDAPLASLRAAMEGLPERDQEVLHLRHHAQMSFKQIADLLEEPVGTLLARHHRALQKLRTILERDPAVAAHLDLAPAATDRGRGLEPSS